MEPSIRKSPGSNPPRGGARIARLKRRCTTGACEKQEHILDRSAGVHCCQYVFHVTTLSADKNGCPACCTAARHLGSHSAGGWPLQVSKWPIIPEIPSHPSLAFATAVRPGQVRCWGPEVDATIAVVHRHCGNSWPEETRNALNQAHTLSLALPDLLEGVKLANWTLTGELHPRWLV